MRTHMRIDIKGLLLQSDSHLKGLFTDDNGKPMPARDLRLFMMGELQKGHAYWPLGKCDNFDYVKKGCMGHPDDSEDPA